MTCVLNRSAKREHPVPFYAAMCSVSSEYLSNHCSLYPDDIHSCIDHIAGPSCPLCRTPFDAGSFVKLHVDMDALEEDNVDKDTDEDTDEEDEEEAVGEDDEEADEDEVEPEDDNDDSDDDDTGDDDDENDDDSDVNDEDDNSDPDDEDDND